MSARVGFLCSTYGRGGIRYTRECTLPLFPFVGTGEIGGGVLTPTCFLLEGIFLRESPRGSSPGARKRAKDEVGFGIPPCEGTASAFLGTSWRCAPKMGLGFRRNTSQLQGGGGIFWNRPSGLCSCLLSDSCLWMSPLGARAFWDEETREWQIGKALPPSPKWSMF